MPNPSQRFQRPQNLDAELWDEYKHQLDRIAEQKYWIAWWKIKKARVNSQSKRGIDCQFE